MFRSFIQSKKTFPRTEGLWKGFNRAFAATFILIASLLFALVFLIDPFGVVPFSIPMERPVVDMKQRHFYPLVVRSKRYDSFVLGTSTIRLVDPRDLDRALDRRFANLALNDARPWELWSLADLYLREVGLPKTIVFGLDGPWCFPDADKPEHRITVRGFPDWIYDENPWNDLIHLINGRTVEFAVRTLVTKFGWRPKRFEDNGYAVFVPPESEYDLARAQQHIWGGAPPPEPQTGPAPPPPPLPPAEAAALAFPALDWIKDLQTRTLGQTDMIFLWTPVHIRSQPAPGSHAAAVEEECKSRVDALARPGKDIVIDWRIPSELTRTDSNYWDALHYRLPVARAMVRSMAAAKTGILSAADGSWHVRGHPDPLPPGHAIETGPNTPTAPAAAPSASPRP